jgi:hypothetical protein
MMYALCIDPERGPAMQQDFIAELKAASTEYLVLVVGTASWVNGFDELPFFSEILKWVETEYQLVALAESRDQKPGIIVWEEAINTFQSQSNYQVFVMRRLPHLRGG